MSDFRRAPSRFVRETEDANSAPTRFTPEFFADLAHGLRAPVTSIQGYINYLLDGVAGDVTPVQRDFLERAGANASRLMTLIAEVVDLFRAGTGTTDIRRENVSLSDEARAVIGSLGLHADGGAIELIVNGNPVIWADRDIFRRALTGLLQRTLAKTPKGACIRMHVTARASDELILTISPPEPVPQSPDTSLWGSFETEGRNDLSRDALHFELSVTQILLEAIGGRVWVETAVDGHPAIHLGLPVANREAMS